MKYINVKKVIALISAGFILISLNGCKKKEESDYLNVSETSLNQQIESEIINEPIDTEPNQYVEIETKEQTEQAVSETIENKEEEVIIYFENLEKEVNCYINESDFDRLKEKVKNIAITGIDFIFYGTEIKGVTFDELTTETKNKIMYIVASIDNKIESKVPNYKETIKNKFGQGYDYVNEKLDEALTYVDGKLEEKYGESYENTKDKASEITESVKENAINTYERVTEEIGSGFTKIKEWYEEKTNKG